MLEKREWLCLGLVTVNEENINHLKYYFGAHETEMKRSVKCSFISEGFILLTFNHSILFSLSVKFEENNSFSKIYAVLL